MKTADDLQSLCTQMIRTANDLQTISEVSSTSNCGCFLLEITACAHQITCFTGRVIYSWMFLQAGQVFLLNFELKLY